MIPTAHERRATRLGMRLAAALVLAGVLFAGCSVSVNSADDDGGGGDGERTFSDDRFAFTFSYPDELRPGEINSVAKSSGDREASFAAALDDDNLVAVSKYKLDVPVTSANLDVAVSELDGVMRELLDQPVQGQPTEIAGFPAIRYNEAIPLEEPAQGESRFVFVIDQRDQYQINCQSTPEKRAQLNAACDRVLATLRRA